MEFHKAFPGPLYMLLLKARCGSWLSTLRSRSEKPCQICHPQSHNEGDIKRQGFKGAYQDLGGKKRIGNAAGQVQLVKVSQDEFVHIFNQFLKTDLK